MRHLAQKFQNFARNNIEAPDPLALNPPGWVGPQRISFSGGTARMLRCALTKMGGAGASAAGTGLAMLSRQTEEQ